MDIYIVAKLEGLLDHMAAIVQPVFSGQLFKICSVDAE
jgi:hypothetical protein